MGTFSDLSQSSGARASGVTGFTVIEEIGQ